jgi:hypothetical protein
MLFVTYRDRVGVTQVRASFLKIGCEKRAMCPSGTLSRCQSGRVVIPTGEALNLKGEFRPGICTIGLNLGEVGRCPSRLKSDRSVKGGLAPRVQRSVAFRYQATCANVPGGPRLIP